MKDLGTTRDGRPILWKPHAGFQTKFLSSSAFECLGGGAAGPGKSACLIADAAADAQHPNCRGLFLRTEYTDMVDIRDRMMALYPSLGATWEATDRRWRFPSGGFVMLAHGGTMTDLGPLLGPEWTSIKFDELSLVKDETIWQMMLSRIRSPDPTVPLKARASANPIGPGREWLRQRFIVPCGLMGERKYTDADTGRTRAYVPGTAEDNPSLPSSYWDGLKDLPPSIQSALRHGDWNMVLGLFYPELTESDRLFITRDQVPPLLDWHEYWGAFDWGFAHPATCALFVRIKQTVYWLDTLYMHRYQDDEQAAAIRGWADGMERACLRMVYAGHDAFAKRQAHVAATETVADLFDRYGIHLERANIDRVAGAKVVRRFVAPLPPGPRPQGHVDVKIVDTVGNRRAVSELASLTPDALNPNAPAKRDANEKGMGGDDGADVVRYGLATPSFEPLEPAPLYRESNVTDGKALPAPWEIAAFRLPSEDGRLDRREYTMRRGDPQDEQFSGEGWG